MPKLVGANAPAKMPSGIRGQNVRVILGRDDLLTLHDSNTRGTSKGVN